MPTRARTAAIAAFEPVVAFAICLNGPWRLGPQLVDRDIAVHALASPEIRRLMTIPGISMTTAAAFMAAIGDIGRFPSPAISSAIWV